MKPTWTANAALPDRTIDQNADPGIDFGGGLCERDARYFIDQEWAQGNDDILWRRTKAGLMMSEMQKAIFAHWLGLQR